MELEGAVAVVTGGASGIGRALARALALDAGASVVAADINESGAASIAHEINAEHAHRDAASPRPAAWGMLLDAADERAVAQLIERVEGEIGPIELWCGNAGIAAPGGFDVGDDEWGRAWSVHVMAHVIACRHMVPRWEARGSGHLLVTASAAGLLTSLGAAPYAVTKHAAVALAEWAAITYGDAGVRVSCLCPQGVRTAMTQRRDGGVAVNQVEQLGMIEPSEVAAVTLDALREDRFLVLPHPEVAVYEQRRAADRDRWLAGMRGLLRSVEAR